MISPDPVMFDCFASRTRQVAFTTVSFVPVVSVLSLNSLWFVFFLAHLYAVSGPPYDPLHAGKIETVALEEKNYD